MSDLVERYVHEMRRYLAQHDRSEVETELRSLIRDQLDDRYKGAPTDEDVVELLKEFGDPRRMAASYGREQYLIGPKLYPILIWVLQRGWVLVPGIVVLVHVLAALLSGEETTLVSLFLETAFLVVQVVFSFTAVVVLVFAVIERTGVEIDPPEQAFDPLELPPVNDPAAVDRAEAVFGIVFGIFGARVLFYFLLVGGLTLQFNLSNPREVIPIPAGWLILFILVIVGTVIINLIALRRGRWSVGLLLAEAATGVISVVCAYFVFLRPFADWLSSAGLPLATLPFVGNAAEIIAVAVAIISLLDTGSKLVKVLFGDPGHPPTFE